MYVAGTGWSSLGRVLDFMPVLGSDDILQDRYAKFSVLSVIIVIIVIIVVRFIIAVIIVTPSVPSPRSIRDASLQR